MKIVGSGLIEANEIYRYEMRLWCRLSLPLSLSLSFFLFINRAKRVLTYLWTWDFDAIKSAPILRLDLSFVPISY